MRHVGMPETCLSCPRQRPLINGSFAPHGCEWNIKGSWQSRTSSSQELISNPSATYLLRTSGRPCQKLLAVADSAEGGQRHAVLHDFCMIIPHSSLIILAGLISMPFGAGWRGAILASTGAVELAVSIKSLQEFQAEKKSTPYTAASAAITLGLAAHFWGALRRQAAFWPKALLSVLAITCVAAFTFLAYNILAGGNPPKQDKAITASESMAPQKAY